MLVAGAQILGAGTNEPVVGQLLTDVGRPARDAAAGEYRREDVGGNAQVVVGRS